MSALTHKDIAEIIRRRFNGPDGDELRYVPLVDPAIRHLAMDVAADPGMRHWLLTNPTTTTVVLDANGVANLSPLVTTPRILLEYLKCGEILPPVGVGYPTQPFQMIDNSGQGQLKGIFDSLQPKCWLGGNLLYTKMVNGAFMVGPISFEVSYWPTLLQLPDTLIHRLVHGDYWTGAVKENAT